MMVCFVGGGNMASALIGGMLKQGFNATQICVVEINISSHAKLQHEFGVRVVTGLKEGIAGSNVIILAVKPQQLHEVAANLTPLLSGQLLISIAAGIRATDLALWLDTQNIVRAMPNTPAMIQTGITGLYALPQVNTELRNTAQNILAAVGSTIWLENETMMDGLTAISGSGPAYVFYFIEALQQAAVELGFDHETARHLALHTFIGASKLADVSSDDVRILRERVTSKNGTTEQAIRTMENHSVKKHIIEAVNAAARRSKEIGDELGSSQC